MKIRLPNIYFKCKKCDKLFKKDFTFVKSIKDNTAYITCSCGNEFKVEFVSYNLLKYNN